MAMDRDGGGEVNILDLFVSIWKHKVGFVLIILVCALVGAATALPGYMSFKSKAPVYKADFDFNLQSRDYPFGISTNEIMNDYLGFVNGQGYLKKDDGASGVPGSEDAAGTENVGIHYYKYEFDPATFYGKITALADSPNKLYFDKFYADLKAAAALHAESTAKQVEADLDTIEQTVTQFHGGNTEFASAYIFNMLRFEKKSRQGSIIFVNFLRQNAPYQEKAVARSKYSALASKFALGGFLGAILTIIYVMFRLGLARNRESAVR